MYVSITRFSGTAESVVGSDRIDEVVSVTSQHPGWRGAFVFQSTEDPSSLVRFTYWDSIESRDALYDSPAARAIGMTERPEGREVLQLIRADRPADPNATPVPPTS